MSPLTDQTTDDKVYRALVYLTTQPDPLKAETKMPTYYVGTGFYNGKLRLGLLDVSLEAAQWSNDDLRKLMIGTIAGTVEQMPESPANCYVRDADPIWEPLHYHCNIAGFVGVETSGRQNWLDVRFKMSSRGGRFNCASMKDKAQSKTDTLLPLYQQNLGVDNVNSFFQCQGNPTGAMGGVGNDKSTVAGNPTYDEDEELELGNSNDTGDDKEHDVE